MGFDISQAETRYRLRFDDPAYADLEVVCRSMSIGSLIDAVNLMPTDDGLPDPATLEAMFKILADGIAEWNLEDSGVPVEVTPEVIRDLPLRLNLAILMAWVSSAVEVEAPLAARSENGKPPPGLFAETAASSPSPPTSPTPT